MNSAQRLHDLGQSLWLDNLSRDLLEKGTLERYIRTLSLTGLTSNPTIFDKAIGQTALYDDTIRRLAKSGKSDEAIFFALAIEDLTQAAALFKPVFTSTSGMDGWVSLEVSPLLANDTAGTVKQATELHAQANVPNLFIKIPGTPEGVPAIEECIFAGVPVNVTLLFSTEQYLASAMAYQRGAERRLAAGRKAPVHSVASLFISRWDRAVSGKVPPDLQNQLGIAVGKRTYKAYRDLLASPQWKKLADQGVPAQRLLWASTGVKDPKASDVLYVETLAAPDTIDTMPDETLLAFADHGKVKDALSANGGDAESVLARFAKQGIDITALAAQLQREGAQSFIDSWKSLMTRVATKRAGQTAAHTA